MGLLWQSKSCGAQRWQSGAALQQCHCYLQTLLHMFLVTSMPIVLHPARQLSRSVGCTHLACGVLQPPGSCFVTCPACSVACAASGVCLLDCFGLSMAHAKPAGAAKGRLACEKCSQSNWHHLCRRALHGLQGFSAL